MTHHITDEQIAQAVARGWCHPSNSGKEMDAELARAISDEVRAVLALAAMQGEPVAYIEHSRDAETGIEETDLVWSRDEDLEGGLFWYTPLYTAPAPAVPSVSFDSEQKGTK